MYKKSNLKAVLGFLNELKEIREQQETETGKLEHSIMFIESELSGVGVEAATITPQLVSMYVELPESEHDQWYLMERIADSVADQIDWESAVEAADWRNLPVKSEGTINIERLWQEFGEVGVNDDGITDIQFLHFPAGTDREEIWHWFDEQHPDGVHALMFSGSEVTVND